MGKYSLIEYCMVILYDTIEEKYVATGNSSCVSLFLFLSILKNTKKSVNTYFRLYKPVWIMVNTKREFNVGKEKHDDFDMDIW